MSKVGLTKGVNSYEAVRQALELIRADIHIPTGKPVLVKPNMVSPSVELAATPVNAVRATLDFLVEMGVRKFIIGEASGIDGDTMGGFRRFGYLTLKERYDIEFRDLNRDEAVLFEALDLNLKPVNIKLARTYFNTYIVSVGRMKTHAITFATMSLKNVAIGAIQVRDRHSPSLYKAEPGWFSHEAKPLNLSIARLNKSILPHLSVIDGVVGMEGAGPMRGTPILSGVALASTDSLALDMVGTQIMGYDYRNIGYLWYAAQLCSASQEQVQVVGEDPTTCVTKYKPYEESAWCDKWWIEDWQEYLKEKSYLLAS